MSAFLQVRDDDKRRYPLRFADVCMTPAILACLHPEQKRAWLGAIHAWWIIARDGAAPAPGHVLASAQIANGQFIDTDTSAPPLPAGN